MGNSLITSVINTLRSGEVQKMKTFSFGQCIISPVSYTKLAWMNILYGTPQIKKKGKDEGAEYKTNTNTLWFRFNAAVSVEQRALVVHEATHAIMDMLKIKMQMKYAEMFAYIAQCQYAMLAAPGCERLSVKGNDKSDLKFAAAWTIAKKLQSGSSVDSENYENLAKIISEDPKYESTCNHIADYQGIY
jgi:hypothetical protein